MTNTAGRLLSVYLVTIVGLAMLTTSGGFVGTAAAGNTAPDCSTVGYTGSGTSSDPYEVENVDQLQCIENQGLGNHYKLGNDIDASETESWGGGFEPLGEFTGTLDGDGHAIDSLQITSSNGADSALFTKLNDGTISDLDLTNATVRGGAGGDGAAGSDGGSTGDPGTAGNDGGDAAAIVLVNDGGSLQAVTLVNSTVEGGNGGAGGAGGYADDNGGDGGPGGDGGNASGLVFQSRNGMIANSTVEGTTIRSGLGGQGGLGGDSNGDDFSDEVGDGGDGGASGHVGGLLFETDSDQITDSQVTASTVESGSGGDGGDAGEIDGTDRNAVGGSGGSSGDSAGFVVTESGTTIVDSSVGNTVVGSGDGGAGGDSSRHTQFGSYSGSAGDGGSPGKASGFLRNLQTGTLDGPTVDNATVTIGTSGARGESGLMGDSFRSTLGRDSAGLVIDNENSIQNALVTNTSVTAGDASDGERKDGAVGGSAGGLAVTSSGTISQSHVAGTTVTAGDGGYGEGSGSGSATGNGGDGGVAGGLVSKNLGTVEEVAVTNTTVTGGDGGIGNGGGGGESEGVGGNGGDGGGLAADNDGTVRDTYVTGIDITAGDGGDGERGGGGDSLAYGGDGGDSGGLLALNTDTATDGYVGSATITEGAGGSGDNNGDSGTPGAFVVVNQRSVDGYWNEDETNVGVTDAGTGLTTTEMQGSSATSNMGGFDFSGTWETVENSEGDTTGDSYPILQSVDRQAQLEAQNVNAYAGGDGTAGNPYEIANWHQLDNVRQNPDKEFVLTADLDSNTAGYSSVASSSANSNNGFDPIGDSVTPFTGTFDGNGHTISGLNIDRRNTQNVGLFGIVSGGTVENVGVESVDINGSNYVGGLVGRNNADVTKSYATGDVNGTKFVGGLIGENLEDVSESYATGNVNATRNVGGLVGRNNANVTESYATGDVKGDEDYGGGLAGLNYGNVTKSYATGDVDGDTVGGLVGFNDVDAGSNGYVANAYATGNVSGSTEVGGLVGFNPGGTVEDAYWNVNTTGQSSSAGSPDSNGLSTAEMQRFAPQVTMDGFSFESPETWLVMGGYPALAWESVTELTVDSVEATSPTVAEDESGTITVTANKSGTDTGEGVTIEVVNNDSLDGFATSDTKVTDTNGEVTFAFDEPDHGTYTPEFAWADDTSVSATPTVTVQDAPEVTSIERASPTSQNTNADSVDFDVTFSTEVDGIDTGDFRLDTTGSASGSIASVGSGTASNTVTVTVDSISGDGDLQLDVSDDDSIKDTTNNVALGGEGTGGSADGSFTSGETYAIDNTPPSLSNFVLENDNSPGSSVGDGDTIRVAVFVSETANNVANVEADLSAFGAPSDVTLDDNNVDGNYDTTVTVDKATANEDGSYSVTIATSDDIGNQNTGSTPSLELNTNEAPTLDTNAGVTVDEGSTANQITNAELAASDPEQSAGSITYDVTTAPSDGTLFVDGGSGGTDDGTRDGESAIGTGTFTQADIDAGNLLYSHDGSEASTDTFDFDLKDGKGGTTAANTFSIALDGVNDPPTLSLSTSDPTFTEDGSSVGVFSSANVGVVEGSQQVNSLELTVSNVADGSAEQLIVDGSSVALTDTTTVITANNALSASVSVSGSTATVTINGGVSESTADTIINNLAYEHTGDDPSTANDRTITLTKLVDDGGTANGGSDTTTFSKSGSVSITSVNDAPTLSVSTSDPTFTEGGSAAEPFSSASTNVVESGQQVERLEFTVINIADGNNERLNVDGSSVALADGTSVSTNNNGLTADVSVSGSTATVTVDGGPFSESTANTIIDNLAYENTDDAPTTDSGRTITITKLVDDGDTTSGGDDTTTLSDFGTVSLTAVNDAPSITIGGDQTANADTTEQTVTDFATGFDPGGGESQSISDFTVTNDNNALFDTQPDITDENNDDKGDLTYTPADGVEGTATVDVQVVDDGGTSNGGEDTSATETFDITIDTSAPTFSSGANPSVAEDKTSVIDVNADDGSGADTGVTYSLVGGADQSAFSIDSNTGALSFSSAPDFENPTDADTSNDYVVDVQADDGVENTNTQTVTVDVTDVDEVPTAPDDSSQSTDEDSTVSVADGDSADLLELASDPDAGDTLSFDSIDGTSFSDGTPVTLGSGATVTVDSDGSWTYDPNGQYESFDSGDSTTDTFTYTVADSDDDTAQGTVTVSITGVNDAPTAISLTSTSVAQSEGTDAVVGSLSATDADDSTHTFSLVGGSGDGDNAEFNIDSGDLRADDASALAAGDYDVRLEADDGSGGTYEKQFTVSVTDDIAPTIASSTPADDATGVSESDDITITFSEDVSFGSGSVTLREDDGGFSDREIFDVSSDTGSGAGTVSISGRTLTITPTSNFASDTEYAVRIDPGALTDTASSPNDFGGISDDTILSFTTTDSALPTASAGPDTTIDEGQSVSFDGTGSMDNVGIVSYDWDFDDDGTTATGQTTSHAFDSPGTYTVELTVTDAAGNTDTDTVEVTVESTGSDGGSSSGSSGSTDTGGDRSTADDASVGTETVVNGTQSSDDSVSFTVNASDDDGPITLDLSETDADRTDGEDESGGNDDSEGEGENTVSVDSLSITPIESGSREFDISVRVWDANIDTSERATESDDTGTDTTDVSDPQGASDGDRARTVLRTFITETSLSPLGYVEVTHTNPDSDIDSVTFRFRIRKDALNQSDVDPSGVALYRNGTDGWTRLPTDEVGENSTHYVFEGTSPGLSLFTIASAQPAFEVMRASSRSETLTASEAVTVNATVRNLGGAAGTYTAELRANGTVVATSDVDLAPNSSRTVSLSFTPSDPGEYTLTVGTVSAGAVSVQSDETPAESTSADQTLTEPTPAEQETTQQTTVATDNSSQTASANGTRETTTDASGPGFGVLVLIGAFLIVIVFFRRRS